jgi:hypothetical protein
MKPHVARIARFENVAVVRSNRLCGRYRARLRETQALVVFSSNNVFTPQVPSRTLITRVPGLRPVREPIQPAVHLRDIVDAETNAGETLAGLRKDLANMVCRRGIAGRRHQFERCVVEGENDGVRAIARASPGGTAPEQDFASPGAGLDIADQYNHMVETADHCKSSLKLTSRPRRMHIVPLPFLRNPKQPQTIRIDAVLRPQGGRDAAHYLSQAAMEAAFANNFSE